MAIDRSPASTTVGFSLLPSELLEDIFLRLTVPDLLRINSVSRTILSFVSGEDFRRLYGRRSASDTWVFLYQKGSLRHHSVLLGFSDRSSRWCRIPIAAALLPAVLPGEDLYFLAAAGDVFLFASNYLGELVAVDLAGNRVKRVPPSPLGPRRTSSWRRSGLKLLAGAGGAAGEFRFLFSELVDDRPYLFSYSSETGAWTSEAAAEGPGGAALGPVFLCAADLRSRSVVVSAGAVAGGTPVVIRPSFAGGAAAGDGVDRLHVYGDGHAAVVRSEKGSCGRVVTCVEIWGVGKGGRRWEVITCLPRWALQEMGRRPFGAMIGCLEERCGALRLVLLSNNRGTWDLVLLVYDLGVGRWSWVPLPSCGAEGLNMAGIAISGGPTLRPNGRQFTK